MKAEFGKFGPKYNYKGAHCTLEWKGQHLLGEITRVYRNEVLGCCLCEVRHMNGEPWPLNPGLGALNILERTFEQP